MDREGRWLWVGWSASVLLGFVAPFYRGVTHIHPLAIGAAAVATMIAVACAIGNLSQCLTMSAFGLMFGATFGFILLAILARKELAILIALQTGIGSLFLGQDFLAGRERTSPVGRERDRKRIR